MSGTEGAGEGEGEGFGPGPGLGRRRRRRRSGAGDDRGGAGGEHGRDIAVRSIGLDGLRRLRLPDVLAALAFALIARRWLTRLTDFLVNDDEGSYLYAAWRISLGERPYCDFLTPQLPGFLMPGGWLMGLAGPDVGPARAMAACAVLLAGVLVWATARRLFGAWAALIAGCAFLLHPDVFEAGRTFRSEPFMLLLQAAGVYVFARAALPRPAAEQPPDRRGLAIAGGLFGLATLTKLFGPLPLGGLLAWLVLDGRRRGRGRGQGGGGGGGGGRGRPASAVLTDIGVALGACLAVVGLGLGAFLAGGCDVVTATFTHHRMQNASAAPIEILGGGLQMLGIYARDAGRAVPAAAALAVALAAWRSGDRRAGLFGWQIPTLLALLVLSRDRFPRHLLYLAPAIATLFGVAVVRIAALGSGTRGDEPAASERGLAVALAAGLAVAVVGAWWLFDRDYLWSRTEDGTRRAADFIALTTAPDDIVLSDYSELNFYARRPTTYSAASLSSGAAASGQITWSRIRAELDAAGREPALVVREIGSPYSHLAQLHPDDAAAFEAWLAASTVSVGTLRRDAQRFEVRAIAGAGAGAGAGTGAPGEGGSGGEDESAGERERSGDAGGRGEDDGGRDDEGRSDGESGGNGEGASDGDGGDRDLGGLPLAARVGERLLLLAASPEGSGAASGERLDILTAWAADGAPGERLVATVRLVDGDGRVWAQADDALRASGRRTTELWAPDELTAHRIGLDLPLGLPPGPYEVALGIYREADLSRLPFHAPGDAEGAARLAITVGVVEVEAWRPRVPARAPAMMGLEGIAGDSGPESGLEVVVAAVGAPGEGGSAGGEVAGPDAGDPRRPLDRGPEVEAGTILPLEIAWRAVDPRVDSRARIALTDPESGAVAADHTFALGVPGAASGTWPEGTVARHRFGLPILGNAASGEYALSVRHIGADGTWLGHAVELGRVAVTARDLSGVVFDLDRADEASFDARLDVTFGEVGALVGAVFGRTDADAPRGDARFGAPTIAAGSAIDVTLVWRAVAPSEWPYVVAVQILDMQGRPIAQSDHQPTPPDGVVRPTVGWIPGEIVWDRHRIDIPADAPAGPAEIAVALYRAETGRRLPARAAAQEGPRIVDDLVWVGRIEIVR